MSTGTIRQPVSGVWQVTTVVDQVMPGSGGFTDIYVNSGQLPISVAAASMQATPPSGATLVMADLLITSADHTRIVEQLDKVQVDTSKTGAGSVGLAWVCPLPYYGIQIDPGYSLCVRFTLAGVLSGSGSVTAAAVYGS